jgi:hypothetical protein
VPNAFCTFYANSWFLRRSKNVGVKRPNIYTEGIGEQSVCIRIVAGVCLDESAALLCQQLYVCVLNCSTQLNCVCFQSADGAVFSTDYAPKLNLYVGTGWIRILLFARWIFPEKFPPEKKKTTTAHSNPAFHAVFVSKNRQLRCFHSITRPDVSRARTHIYGG